MVLSKTANMDLKKVILYQVYILPGFYLTNIIAMSQITVLNYCGGNRLNK